MNWFAIRTKNMYKCHEMESDHGTKRMKKIKYEIEKGNAAGN